MEKSANLHIAVRVSTSAAHNFLFSPYFEQKIFHKIYVCI